MCGQVAVEHLDYWDHRLVVLSATFPNDLLRMAGAIIENMSTKKLVFLGFIFFVFQVLCIMVGALIGE